MLEKSRRVVIRGVGLVSCLGVTVSESWMRLLRNDCGIGLLEGMECCKSLINCLLCAVPIKLSLF